MIECHGTAVPTINQPGYSKNASFRLTTAAAGTSGLYTNVGTNLLCNFVLVDTSVGAPVPLTNTHILVGNVSGVATDVAASGDLTLANTGAFTIAANAVTGAKLVTGKGYFSVAVTTNGTTPVNVFAATVPFNATITGVYLIANDTTAGTITLADTAGTVATIAKGTTASVMVGATSLANTAVTSGNTLTVVSSSAGNATVFVTFTVA